MSYYDNPASRSPISHRSQQQTLHRQPSRQFDAYGQLPAGLYTAEDHAVRYDPSRSFPDRMNATMHSGFGGYDMASAQAWNSFGHSQNNALAAIGATTRMKPNTRGRSALPQGWMDQSQPLPSMSQFGGLGAAGLAPAHMRADPLASDMDDELIPTAIVIKNIPFAVKKEQLVQLMSDMRLPLPYAFNYHFDNGVFRGLAFANFTTAEETACVIDTLNHFDLSGRKLRVEYKKMLPLAERERIEREKRERRGQLEEQHRPMPSSQLHTQPSISSLSSRLPATSPSPVSARDKEYDLNDPQHLHFYNQLLLFKEDQSRDMMTFPSTLTPIQRRIVHVMAHNMHLGHTSKGENESRQVHIFRTNNMPSNMSPPLPQLSTSHLDSSRRALNRAATTDFSDVRGSDNFYNTLGRQTSHLGFPESPGGLTAGHNLRAAKSYADLRSYTPSPAQSTASFPAPSTNFGRYTDYGFGGSSTNPSVTPTTTASMSTRDESYLINGFGGMSLGGGFGSSTSPQRLRGMGSWDREAPGPIGGHRQFSTAFDDNSRERLPSMPSRQPRGPLPERGQGFPSRRQNGHQGRGSDELSTQSGVEIVVEQ